MNRKLAAMLTLALVIALAITFVLLRPRGPGPWVEWQVFAKGFVLEDGRVVDRTAGERSTSEGQAYGLFFALAANDRVRYDRILRWTADNLAGGDLAQQLPAWLWGRKDDGSWGVLDANPATDADLWLAYALLEGARLWADPQLGLIGRGLLTQVQAREMVEVPGLGRLLLPGVEGFRKDDGSLRLNPSYYPELQFHYLAAQDPTGPWSEIWRNYLQLAPAIWPNGLAPDWVLLAADGSVQPDTETAGKGSYDAIRVYLWAGMAGAGGTLLTQLAPFAGLIRAGNSLPPESVDTRSGSVEGAGPLGFSAAVLPYLKGLGEDAEVKHQLERLRSGRTSGGDLGEPAHYYDQVLALFGEGWFSGRFAFEPDGRLKPQWQGE